MIFSDQLKRSVELPVWPPRRIVSLVPSQTELLCELGLESEVIGITKFCVHPRRWFESKQRVGGTKTLNLQKIAALQPDLIIGNKEENEREQIEHLTARFPVWMSDIDTFDTACDMIACVGELSGKVAEAGALVARIRACFDVGNTAGEHRPKTAYFIWRKPWMVAGGDTFISDMLGKAGFANVFAGRSRYPEISLDELAALQPEVILLSSEPYPFAEKHFGAFREVCPRAQIRCVDGEMFSWYGSRMLYAADYFAGLHKKADTV